MQTHTTATIRDRWQLTIPCEIRQVIDWAKPKSVVSLILTQKNELIIKPISDKINTIDWKKVWQAIAEARAISALGKKVNLSRFIVKDRERHRI